MGEKKNSRKPWSEWARIGVVDAGTRGRTSVQEDGAPGRERVYGGLVATLEWTERTA